jgi:hypothetical protein
MPDLEDQAAGERAVRTRRDHSSSGFAGAARRRRADARSPRSGVTTEPTMGESLRAGTMRAAAEDSNRIGPAASVVDAVETSTIRDVRLHPAADAFVVRRARDRSGIRLSQRRQGGDLPLPEGSPLHEHRARLPARRARSQSFEPLGLATSSAGVWPLVRARAQWESSSCADSEPSLRPPSSRCLASQWGPCRPSALPVPTRTSASTSIATAVGPDRVSA